MQIIRYESLKTTPGAGGVSRHLAAGPAGAGSWKWQISLADVAKASPLPPLPGTERIITVVEGELIALTVDGAEQALEKYRPFRFSGDSETFAALPTGALRCLFLTAQRDSFKGYAAIIELSKKRPHPVFADQFAVLLQGSATVSGTPATSCLAGPLGKFDTVVGAEEAPEISGRGLLAVLSIDPVS